MASLKLTSLTKQYPKNPRPTLDGLDLDIHDGEFLVLVGPSGCGKSTLLRTIAGLESITGGDLWIGDQRVNQLRPRDRDIAMVFQSYALYPHMTVRRNMAFGLEVRKMPRDEIDRRVGEAAQILGLEAHLDKLPRALSGGQRQRVAMGRAIVREPKVFLFDEPLSNLDASLRNQMRVEIKKLHTQLATTMIYVTHDQVEAMTLADRIAVLDRGHLQQVSPPLELFYQPANRFVAGFIGHPSMNTFEGTLRHEGGEWSVHVTESHTLALVPPAEHRLEAGMQVAVGVRPQSVRLASPEQRDDAVKATIDVIETLGWESHIHAHVGPFTVLAAVSSQDAWQLKSGDEIWLDVPADALYVFDAERGDALFQRPIDSAQEVAWPVEASA